MGDNIDNLPWVSPDCQQDIQKVMKKELSSTTSMLGRKKKLVPRNQMLIEGMPPEKPYK